MFDIRVGDVSLAVIVLVVSVVIILPVQLLLCFKVKSRKLRFMPAIILFLAAMANVVMYLVVSDWKRQVFACGAIYIVFMMLACSAGWGIWAAIKAIIRKIDML